MKTLNTPALGVRRELGAPLSSHLEILPPSKGMFGTAKAVESVVPNSTQLHGTPFTSFVLAAPSPLLALIRPSASISISKTACAHPALSPGHLLPLGPMGQ